MITDKVKHGNTVTEIFHSWQHLINYKTLTSAIVVIITLVNQTCCKLLYFQSQILRFMTSCLEKLFNRMAGLSGTI